jgi:hypothetical protein
MGSSMTHRTDTVFLAADIARCEPSKPCDRKEQCARYKAIIPAQGASLGDFTSGNYMWAPVVCTYFTAITKRTTKPAKPTIHEAPEGLRWLPQ